MGTKARGIKYMYYQTDDQMPHIMELIQKDLSEPYSIYTFRYFIYNWGRYCYLAYDEATSKCVGAIVCKLDIRDSKSQNNMHANVLDQNTTMPVTFKGYIAMLVVDKEYRKFKIGSTLVKLAVNAMREAGADEVVLETEVINKPALKLYENLGFLRDKRLFRYYLNGLDALRLKLWIDTESEKNVNDQKSMVSAMAEMDINNGGTQFSDQNSGPHTAKTSTTRDHGNKTDQCIESGLR